jgi:hypothetical protein
MYVLKKGHEYVAKSGSRQPYTTELDKAEKFDTHIDAQSYCCNGETICPVYGPRAQPLEPRLPQVGDTP